MKLLAIFTTIFFSTLNTNTNKLPQGFVYLNDISPDIEVDLRYFSSNNFIGDTIDGYHSKNCIITIEAAKAIERVQKELKTRNYGLKIFDAYRPQQAVDHFVRWVQDVSDNRMKANYYPDMEKRYLLEQKYILAKSGHTRGSTVDLTIIYLEGEHKGEELDMGTPWDFFGTKSWPTSDEVSETQKSNRMLLQNAMIKYGFSPYNEEWWHFTLKKEPFPDTYFNFPVK